MGKVVVTVALRWLSETPFCKTAIITDSQTMQGWIWICQVWMVDMHSHYTYKSGSSLQSRSYQSLREWKGQLCSLQIDSWWNIGGWVMKTLLSINNLLFKERQINDYIWLGYDCWNQEFTSRRGCSRGQSRGTYNWLVIKVLCIYTLELLLWEMDHIWAWPTCCNVYVWCQFITKIVPNILIALKIK